MRKEKIKMNVYKIENLTKVYGKGESEVKAINNVSFKVNEGEFIAIIGPSGRGKSTLLHSLAGLEKPSTGHIYFYNEDLYKKSKKEITILRREKIGVIYQFYNLIPTLNVVENITLPLELDKKKINKEKLNDIIALLELEDRKDHLPNELSGGQQQKVAIGRAIMMNPKVILADEPTGNLDVKSSNEIINLLKETNKRYNQTVILITHNLDISKQANRIIEIEDGKIIKDIS